MQEKEREQRAASRCGEASQETYTAPAMAFVSSRINPKRERTRQGGLDGGLWRPGHRKEQALLPRVAKAHHAEKGDQRPKAQTCGEGHGKAEEVSPEPKTRRERARRETMGTHRRRR